MVAKDARGGAKRYVVGNVAVPMEERDRFRMLSRRSQHTYRNLKTREPEVGEEGAYEVELTDAEYRALLRERPDNLRHLEPVQPVYPDVTAAVPSQEELQAMGAGNLHAQGFTGAGITVGVIDAEGIGASVLSRFSVKAVRDGSTSGPTNHGSNVASLAVPRGSRLAFAKGGDTAATTSALYWMADTVGVDVINMSFANAGGSNSAQNDAIAGAKAKGIALFASAGNDSTSTQQFPAANANVVAVGALASRGSNAKASYSNFGSWVDLWVNGTSVLTYDEAGAHETATGTSMAAPLAAHAYASKLTKGKDSIGPVATLEAMMEGSSAGPSDGGGGKKLDSAGGLAVMPSKCA